MLSEKVRTRVRERIYKRYKRLGKKLGKNWKEIEIDGKLYKDALEFEFAKEEQLAEKGEESMLKRSRKFDPEKIKEFTPKRRIKSNMDWLAEPSDAKKTHEEECQCPKCVGAFGSENLEDLLGPIPESDERRQAREQFTKEVNEQLEQACTRGICSRCKSSVCRCNK